jgi:DNA-binding response OmpR family regulator
MRMRMAYRRENSMRILLVDNHPEFTVTVVEQFLGAHDVIVVPTIAGAKHQIETAGFDVVLVDFDLDDGKGDELVRWLRGTGSRIAVVAVSARESGNNALVAAGANVVCAKLSFAAIASVLASLN